MDAVISVINDLQAVFKSTGHSDNIDLPEIVVVGSQSCGKSSVLESLVRKSFLPRGSGIVTRCPITIQLTHTTETDENRNAEWCILKNANEKDEIYTDYDEVRLAIERRTEINAGTNRGISMIPIIVKFFSPHVLSLTVVDLPGVVKVPVGDQSLDIEEQVHNLIMKYIGNPNSIILAVSPANADIATSESIKIAKEVDPNGDRTLAIITKLDLMDKGTDASSVLRGEVSTYGRLVDEKTFLMKNYPSFDEIGSEYLAHRLSDLLQSHIKMALPDLVRRIEDMTRKYEERREKLGREIPVDVKFLPWFKTVHEFIKDYKARVESGGGQESASVDTEDLLLAPEIVRIFDNFDITLTKEHIDNVNSTDESKLQEQIQNTVNLEGFTSLEGVFKNLAKKMVVRFEKSSLNCADRVHKVLAEAIKDSVKDMRLQKLNEETINATKRVLKQQLQSTKHSISEYIRIQTTMVYSKNGNFNRLLQTDVDETPGPGAALPVTTIANNMGNQCTYVKTLVRDYVEVLRGHFSDYVPKHIVYHLYKSTLDKLSDEIMQGAAGRESELLKENDLVVRRRRETEDMLKSLYEASDIVNRIECGI